MDLYFTRCSGWSNALISFSEVGIRTQLHEQNAIVLGVNR